MSLQPIPAGPLRWGYSTGACATACTKAALTALITQEMVADTEIRLPGGETVLFRIQDCEYTKINARCSTYKDGGDDPDVTHGAEIRVTVAFDAHQEVRFLQGEGVGRVTLPGLSIPVGQPAINPVPRRMMSEVVSELLNRYQLEKGINITVSVPGGAAIAVKTLNSRLGIIGGISILGTTGLVKPFSASAYIASIEQGIDVALANGLTEVVINSGGRSERLLQTWAPHYPAWAFIQYGNWIGETLAKLRSTPIQRFTIGMMLGKATKLAAGNLNTHSNESSWDKEFIATLATTAGYPDSLITGIRALNRAGRLTELFPFQRDEPFYTTLAAECRKTIRSQLDTPFTLVLIDATDRLLLFEDET